MPRGQRVQQPSFQTSYNVGPQYDISNYQNQYPNQGQNQFKSKNQTQNQFQSPNQTQFRSQGHNPSQDHEDTFNRGPLCFRCRPYNHYQWQCPVGRMDHSRKYVSYFLPMDRGGL